MTRPSPGNLLIAILVLLSASLASAIEVDEPKGVQPPAAVDGQFYQWAFQNLRSVEAVRAQLGKHLEDKVRLIDELCGISEEQKKDLTSAGERDIEKVLPEVEELREKYEGVKDDRVRANELLAANGRLRQVVRFSGPSGGNLSFDRALDEKLSPEQLRSLAPFRGVVEAGGSIKLRKVGGADRISVTVTSKEFGDGQLLRLSTRADIEGLSLSTTSVTDAGLLQLRRMTGLTTLNLSSAAITSVGVERLGELSEIETLVLNGTAVDDAALPHIGKLKKLRYLGLERTRVTGRGLAALKGLNFLRQLMVARTDIVDEDLVHLADLTSLTFLDLTQTSITDRGLTHLRGLQQLSTLQLPRATVTDAGVDALKQAIPMLSVSRR